MQPVDIHFGAQNTEKNINFWGENKIDILECTNSDDKTNVYPNSKTVVVARELS